MTVLVLLACVIPPNHEKTSFSSSITASAPCDGYDPELGATVSNELTSIGYGNFTPPEQETLREVIQDDATWSSETTAWNADGSLTPDFSTEAVFVNLWTYDGCSGPVSYPGWTWAEVLRLRAIGPDDGYCDAAFPTLDLVKVPKGMATDLGWCE